MISKPLAERREIWPLLGTGFGIGALWIVKKLDEADFESYPSPALLFSFFLHIYKMQAWSMHPILKFPFVYNK